MIKFVLIYRSGKTEYHLSGKTTKSGFKSIMESDIMSDRGCSELSFQNIPCPRASQLEYDFLKINGSIVLFLLTTVQIQSNSLHYNRKYLAPFVQGIRYRLDILLVLPKYQLDYKEYDGNIHVLYRTKSFESP